MFRNVLKIKQCITLLRRNPWLLVPNRNSLNYARYKFSKKTASVDISKCGIVFTTLLLTRRCNLNCSFCIVAKSRATQDIKQFDMKFDQFSKIINHEAFNRSLYIMLSGGEPLLNENIFEMIHYLKKQKRLVAMTTNGTLLGGKIDALMREKIDSINISVYDTNIKVLRTIVPDVARRCFVKLCKVVTRSMLKEPRPVEEAAELAVSAKCSGLYLANIMPGPGTPADLHQDVIYDDDPDYPAFRERLRQKFPGLAINFFEPLHRDPRQIQCQMPWYFGIVDNQGNLGFCCYDSLCNKGNVFDTHPEGVYNRVPWLPVRQEILQYDSGRNNFCKDCYLANEAWSSRI